VKPTTPVNAVLSVEDKVLTVTATAELDDIGGMQLQRAVLDRAALPDVTGAILDFSAVRVLDRPQAKFLAATIKMLRLLGVSAVVVGFRAGIAATLAEHGIDDLPCESSVARGRKVVTSRG